MNRPNTSSLLGNKDKFDGLFSTGKGKDII